MSVMFVILCAGLLITTIMSADPPPRRNHSIPGTGAGEPTYGFGSASTL